MTVTYIATIYAVKLKNLKESSFILENARPTRWLFGFEGRPDLSDYIWGFDPFFDLQDFGLRLLIFGQTLTNVKTTLLSLLTVEVKDLGYTSIYYVHTWLF